jgi:FMN phosphatase YigB (HAD superfamily)
MNKVFVFDMDGVLLKHQRLSKIVSKRSVSFVKEKVNRYMSDDKASKINEQLYKNFGHTVIGLKHIFDESVTLQEFNDYVYDYELLSRMHLYDKTNEFWENTVNVNSIISKLREKNIPFYIFSNAPCEWCKNSLDMMNIDNIEDKFIIGCDSSIHNKEHDIGILKPYIHGYENIDNLFANDDNIQIIFIDDQQLNLRPVISSPKWKAILLTNNENELYIDSFKISCIDNITKLSILI